MGNGVPTIMDYASPYINLAFALKDREKEEEDRELQKEQLKLENEWKAKQIGYQENANKIAMDTNKLNRERFESDKSQREIENASKPANQRPLSKELVTNLVSEMNKKDAETGIKLYGAYAEPMKTLVDSAGTKTALESYYDFAGSLASNKDAIITSLQQEKAKAGNDPQKIQAIDKAIADVSAGGKQMLAKFFPGIHTMVQAELATKNQERMDKLALAALKENNVTTADKKYAYEVAMQNLSGEFGISEDATGTISSRPLNKTEAILAQKKAAKYGINLFLKEAETEVIDNPGWFTGETKIPKWVITGMAPTMETVGGNLPATSPVQAQPQERPDIGGAGENSLTPTSGPVLGSDTRTPIIPDPDRDIYTMAGMISKTIGSKKVKPDDLPALKESIDAFTKIYGKDPQVMAKFEKALKGAEFGVLDPIDEDPSISRAEVESIMRTYKVDRPTAIEIVRQKSEFSKKAKKGIKKGIEEIGGAAGKGIEWLGKINSSAAY